MHDDDSKENRGKPKEHLLEWVRKKTGYVCTAVLFVVAFLTFCCFAN